MSRISVIIPTHNRAKWLPEAVKSAQEGGTDIEVIVVDDASTDETPAVCKSLKGVHVLRLERNVHLAGARNAGIAASSGEYLSFLDDDDLRLPGSLDNQLRTLDANPDAGFMYGPVMIGDPNKCVPTGEIFPHQCFAGDIFWRLLKANFFSVNSVLVRRRCLEDVGFFDASLRGVEDWDLWIRLAERYSVLATEKPVGIYRACSRTSNQMSSSRLEMCKVSARVQRPTPSTAQAATRTQRREVRKRYLDFLAWELLRETKISLSEWEIENAVINFFTALRLSPWEVMRPQTLRRAVTKAFATAG